VNRAADKTLWELIERVVKSGHSKHIHILYIQIYTIEQSGMWILWIGLKVDG
jgi:hypothetical protein